MRRGKLILTIETAPDPYLISGLDADGNPEDDVLDTWAAYIAANGFRSHPVRLTERERILATALIIAQDREDTLDLVTARLGVSVGAALHLIEKVAEQGIDLQGVEFSLWMSTSNQQWSREHDRQ